MILRPLLRLHSIPIRFTIPDETLDHKDPTLALKYIILTLMVRAFILNKHNLSMALVHLLKTAMGLMSQIDTFVWKKGHEALRYWYHFDKAYQDTNIPQALAALTISNGAWRAQFKHRA